jgi:hypothetical protein
MLRKCFESGPGMCETGNEYIWKAGSQDVSSYTRTGQVSLDVSQSLDVPHEHSVGGRRLPDPPLVPARTPMSNEDLS